MNVDGGGPEDEEEAAAMEGASGSDGDASDASGDTCFSDGDASDARGDTSLSDGDPSDASTSSEADYAYYEEDDDPDAGMHNIDEGGFDALLAQLGADFEPAREALDTGSELAAELRALTGGGGGGGGGVDGAHTPPVMASAYAMLARREGNTRAHVRAAPTLAPAETGGAGGEVAPSPASTPPPKRARAGRESGLDFTGSGTGVGGADAGAPPALTADPGSPATPPVGAAARPPPRSMPGGCGLGARTGTFSPAAQRHLAQRFLPTCAAGNLDDRPARAYIARFSRDGSVAVAGFQDSRIRLYDATGAGAGEGVGTSMGGAAVLKDVSARSVQWTVTDVDLTPDGEVLAYSSINPTVRLARVGAAGGVESVANVTDVHENVDLLTERETEAGFHMGVWAVEFSADGKALLAGTSAHAAVVYDMESAQTTAWILGHNDDVNGCCFADQSGHIFFTASDDCTAKVWVRARARASARLFARLFKHACARGASDNLRRPLRTRARPAASAAGGARPPRAACLWGTRRALRTSPAAATGATCAPTERTSS